MNTTRVVLADDHPLVCHAVRVYLARLLDIALVDELARGADLEAAIRQHRPDLLILDLSMEQGFDAVATIHRMRYIHPCLKIVVLSAHDQVGRLMEMLEAKVPGYVHKTESLSVLVQAIRAVMNGGLWYSHRLLQAVAAQHWCGVRLAPYESTLLQGIADGQTTAQLASQMSISQRTVRQYLSATMRKLEVRTRAEACF